MAGDAAVFHLPTKFKVYIVLSKRIDGIKWGTFLSNKKTAETSIEGTQTAAGGESGKRSLSPTVSLRWKKFKASPPEEDLLQLKDDENMDSSSCTTPPAPNDLVIEKVYCRRNHKYSRLSTPGELKSSAFSRAQDVQSKLDPKYPSCLKLLAQSHVGHRYRMVYIIRTNDLKKRISGASASSDAPRRSSRSNVTKKSKGDPVLPLPSKAFRGRPRHGTGHSDEAIELRLDHRAWDSGLNFQDFHTFMNELLKECQLPENVQRTYCELCRSRNMFLHGHHLVKNIKPYLTAGAIVETVRVAEAIRACTFLTSEDKLMTLDKSLKALEALGMTVGFLHARIQQLRSLVLDSESLMDKKKKMKKHVHSEMLQNMR